MTFESYREAEHFYPDTNPCAVVWNMVFYWPKMLTLHSPCDSAHLQAADPAADRTSSHTHALLLPPSCGAGTISPTRLYPTRTHRRHVLPSASHTAPRPPCLPASLR